MKQKLFFVILAFLVAITVHANGTEINGIYYELDSSTKTASVTFTGNIFEHNPSSTAYTGSITIPASVTYDGTVYSVTSIGGRAFSGCTGLTSISIPASVTSIGDYAFYRCTGLTSITIPYSVTSIGRDAFGGCEGLTEVNITDITAWCAISFSNYSANPLPYAHHLYLNGEEVKELTIPEPVTSIGNGAFYGCTGLTSISIPASVTSIGYRAFYGCTGLASIKVEAGNTAYDSRENCNAIIETASNTLIAGCMNTTIPNSVTSIGSRAFYGCKGLKSLTIPASVTSIGVYAFYGCTGLTSISIPASVTSIGSYAFSACSGLASIKVEEGNTAYDSRENSNAIIETASNTLVAGCMNTTIPNSVTAIGNGAFEGCKGLTSFTIPSSVTKIGDYAFYGCTGLTSISIPASVTTIGEGAFYDCTRLTDVTIPSSVTSIGDYAFSGCSGLTSLTIPASVTYIGFYAFQGCTGLTSLTIPASVTYIGFYAFQGCTGLTDIYALRTDPAAYICFDYAFDDVPFSTCTLHVPNGSKEAYAATKPWSKFQNIVEYDASGIEPLTLTPTEADAASYYNLQGQRITNPQRGQIVIQRNADGTSRKVLVK